MIRRLLLSVACLLGLSLTASAQWPCASGWGQPYSYFPGGDRPPFFALYPPVYYSYPVPRSYGYSPFAYPGHTPTPEVEISEPMTIINPHTAPAAPAPQNKSESLPQPANKTSALRDDRVLLIENPYLDQPVSPILPASKSY